MTLADQFKVAQSLIEKYEIPRPSQAFLELNALFKKSQIPDLVDVTEILGKDLPLTAEVLRLANTSLFIPSPQTPITTLQKAVEIIGLVHLQTVVMTATMNHYLQTFADREIQEHAVDSAILANLIAQKVPSFAPQQAYLLGLIHNIGALILAQYEADYEVLFYRSIEHPYQSYKQEIKRFQTSHSIIGSILLSQWEMPRETCKIVLSHHKKKFDQITQPKIKTGVAILQLANYIISELRFASHLNEELHTQKTVCLNILSIKEKQLDEIRQKYLAEHLT